MRTSEHIGKLAEALAKAQGKFENPVRNRRVHVVTKSGSGYDFHYATLDRILEQVRPILSENGLAVIQAAETKEGRVIVTSRLAHSSDEWIESELSLKPEDDDPQKCGSAITYGKRYLLTSMLGIAADEDDDGNAAAGSHVEKSEERPACPKCGTNKSVIKGKEEYGGGWLCFAKKGGCGEKWQDTTDKANAIAEQHGMKTGDKLPVKEKLSSGVKNAFDRLKEAVAAHDTMAVAEVMNKAATYKDSGKINDDELGQITREATLALQKIKAIENDPTGKQAA